MTKQKRNLKVDEVVRKATYIEIPETISCIELTMKHDKSGNVIGWMEGEPKADNWDGSIDNQIMILEDKMLERMKHDRVF